jgi:decaprenylphospho-beta-D-ribofuranose 2-oxidase
MHSDSLPGCVMGWGRLPSPGRIVPAVDLERDSRQAILFRGLGRSYGDSAAPPRSCPVVHSTGLANRILGFDRTTGTIRAEAGLSLFELNELFLRDRWFVPVSPGTQFVTLGGMVAADVHGKNHHVDGCFGDHVDALRLRVADGRIVECSEAHERDLFRATIGGMGLTGHILEVQFRLRRLPSAWIWQETRRIDDLASFGRELKAAAGRWPFTVGWVDCLVRGRAMGRGVLMCGRWASPDEAPRHPPPHRRTWSVPFVWPRGLLGPAAVRAFNAVYFRSHLRRVRAGLVHSQSFFYPLDTIRHWNRIYGPDGFTQYQCVLPDDGSGARLHGFFELLTGLRSASFLCVIKDCGQEGTGVLSFPMRGTSIALDVPVRRDTQRAVDELNAFVASEGGRIYLCKDAFTRPEHFRAMEPRLDRFLAIRRRWDPDGRIRSAQSVRLFGDRP